MVLSITNKQVSSVQFYFCGNMCRGDIYHVICPRRLQGLFETSSPKMQFELEDLRSQMYERISILREIELTLKFAKFYASNIKLFSCVHPANDFLSLTHDLWIILCFVYMLFQGMSVLKNLYKSKNEDLQVRALVVSILTCF